MSLFSRFLRGGHGFVCEIYQWQLRSGEPVQRFSAPCPPMVSARNIDMGRESRNLSQNSYLMWTACAFGTPCCLAGNSSVSFCTWSCIRSMRKQQTRTRVQASTRRDTNIGSIKLLLEWVYDWPVVDWLQLIFVRQSCRISVTGKQETSGCGETCFYFVGCERGCSTGTLTPSWDTYIFLYPHLGDMCHFIKWARTINHSANTFIQHMQLRIPREWDENIRKHITKWSLGITTPYWQFVNVWKHIRSDY